MSEQVPLVSVIIPAFNQQARLQQCLNSVLAQPVADIEVLVVDDGSTDATSAIARAVARQDGRVRLLQQANAGAGAARNYGLRHASGRYVHFVDADDWLQPDAYAHWQQAAVRYPRADVLLANFNEADVATGQVARVAAYAVEDGDSEVGSFDAFHAVLLQGPVMPWNRWLRRAFVLGLGAQFDEIAFANDRAFHFRTVVHASQVVLLGAALVNYRVGSPQSLAAQVGLPRLQASLCAFEGATQAVAHLPQAMQHMVFSQCMHDVVGLYARSTPQQQPAMARVLVQELAAPWVPFSPYLSDGAAPAMFAQAPWWGQWQVVQLVAGGAAAVDAEQAIPVVFAVNAAYVPFMAVALQSIDDSLAPGWRCTVFVLHLGLPTETVRWLQQGLGLAKVSVHCIQLGGACSAVALHTRAHYSPEMYLRLWIPELLSVYPKLVYLDADVVVRRSLHHLYAVDVSACDVAGVQDPNNNGHKSYVEQRLNVAAEQYINSGVLVFNTANCLAHGFRSGCFAVLAAHEKLNCPDQDMINVACKGRIGLLDPGWNYLWNYGFACKRRPPDGPAWFADVFEEARSKKYIVHFSSAIKPWDHMHDEDADIFWTVAKRSAAYRQVLREACLRKSAALARLRAALDEAA